MVALYATTTDIYKKNMQSFSLFTSHFSHLISLPALYGKNSGIVPATVHAAYS